MRRARPAPDRRHALGRKGERVAARHLRRAGLRILGRNLRTPVGEVDLLALDTGATHPCLVVVEVKTGARADPETLEARIDRDQRRRLRSAVRWVEEHAVGGALLGSRGRGQRGGRQEASGQGARVHARCDWILVRLDTPRPLVTHIRDVFG